MCGVCVMTKGVGCVFAAAIDGRGFGGKRGELKDERRLMRRSFLFKGVNESAFWDWAVRIED